MASRYNVRRMRESMGLTPEQLADQLGVHARTVQRWEYNETDPSPLAIRRLRGIWSQHLQTQSQKPAQAQAQAEDQTPTTDVAPEQAERQV